jgi:hypothetical protein
MASIDSREGNFLIGLRLCWEMLRGLVVLSWQSFGWCEYNLKSWLVTSNTFNPPKFKCNRHWGRSEWRDGRGDILILLSFEFDLESIQFLSRSLNVIYMGCPQLRVWRLKGPNTEQSNHSEWLWKSLQCKSGAICILPEQCNGMFNCSAWRVEGKWCGAIDEEILRAGWRRATQFAIMQNRERCWLALSETLCFLFKWNPDLNCYGWSCVGEEGDTWCCCCGFGTGW